MPRNTYGNRQYTPEECQRMCEDAVKAAEKVREDEHLNDPQTTAVNIMFGKLFNDLQIGGKITGLLLGGKLKDEAEAMRVSAKMLLAFADKYEEGLETCAAKGGSPACK